MSEELKFIQKSKKIVRYKCGHSGAARFAWLLGTVEVELREEYWTARPFCPDCAVKKFRNAFTLCVSCRQIIGPGDDVSVGTAGPGIWCMRQECAPGIAITGRWTENGYEGIQLLSTAGGIHRMGFSRR